MDDYRYLFRPIHVLACDVFLFVTVVRNGTVIVTILYKNKNSTNTASATVPV